MKGAHTRLLKWWPDNLRQASSPISSQPDDLLVLRHLANSIFDQEHGVLNGAQVSRAALQFLSLPSGFKPSQERDCCHLPKPPQSSAESPNFKFTKAKSSCLALKRLMLTARHRAEGVHHSRTVQLSCYKEGRRAGEGRCWKGLSLCNKATQKYCGLAENNTALKVRFHYN